MSEVVRILPIALVAWQLGPLAALAYVGLQVYGDASARRAARRLAQAQRDAYNASLTDRTVSVVGADNPWQVIYGEATVAPAYVAVLTSGDRDQYKHLVAVWAAHECQAIEEVFINGVSMGTLDGSGYVTSGNPYFNARTETRTETHTVTSGTLTVDYTVAQFLSGSWPPGADGEGNYPTFTSSLATVAGNVITLDASLLPEWEGRVVTVNYDRTVGEPRLRVLHHLGTDSQTADAALLAEVPAEWTAADRGRGLCYSVFRFDLNEPEFQGGPPQPKARIKGRKVYDPRLDTTQAGGSGAHRRDDPTTWAWSANNALCTADFLRAEWGKRASAAQMNWPSCMATANACDTGVDYGSGSVPLYTCNGSLRTDQDPEVTLDQLCQSMAGFATFNGTWHLQAGTYTAPVMALTDADCAGPIELVPGLALGEAINGLRGRFYDPARFDELTDYPPYSNAAFVAADGEAWYDDLNLPFTNSTTRCHQLARVMVERTRGTQLVYPAKMRAVRLKPGQRVTLSNSMLGLTAAVCRVVTREYTPGSPVKLTLVQDDATFYDLVDAPAPLPVPTVSGTNPFRVDPVGSLNAASDGSVVVRDADGTVITRVLVTYTASTDVLVRSNGALELEYRLDNEAGWQRAPEAPGDSTSLRLPSMRDERLYILRARWRNGLGITGDWRATTVFTNAASTLPSGGSGLSNALVFIYQRAASAPTLPSATAVYTFATAALTGLNNGWTATIPAGSNPLWVAVATASSSGASDNIAPGEWASPQILAQNGANGGDGINSATVYLFQRTGSASAPSLPSATVTYTFATGAASGVNNGWSQSLPTSGGAYRWVTTASALSTGATDTIAAGEWAAASLLAEDGTDGNDGTNGTSVFAATIYKQATTAPSAPTGGTFNFSSGVLTPPSGWTATLPAASATDTTYATTYTFSTGTPGATVTAGSWATPVALGGGPPAAFTATLSGGYGTTVSTGAPRNLGARSVSLSGGVAGYTYQWSLQDWAWSDDSMLPEWYFNGGTDGSSATLFVQASATTTLTGRLQCMVVDAAGRTAVGTASVNVTIS